MKPSLLMEMPMNSVERFIEDDHYVMEQKLDGARAMYVFTKGEPSKWLTRGGKEIKFSAATQHLPELTPRLDDLMNLRGVEHAVIDGELIIHNGQYWVFDMPRLISTPVVVYPHMPWHKRNEALALMFSRLRRVPTARTRQQKRSLVNEVERRGGEGVVAKRFTGPYTPNQRTDVKMKFVKTADVVVMSAQRGTTPSGNPSGSATFGVYTMVAKPELVRLGSCSLIGKPDVRPGDVIEVAYLYRPDNGALVQPRMRRVRPDRDPRTCTFEQFPAYSREVLTISP